MVTDETGKTRIQISCYRLFLINIIGNCSITSVLIDKAKKYGFFIALYSAGFHIKHIIGSSKEGNYLLRRKQYSYENIDLAKHIVKNKIASEYIVLKESRQKTEDNISCLEKIKEYYYGADTLSDLQSLMAYEGIVAKIYFSRFFDNVNWKGRKPRIKCDFVNSTLDIGYTMLFNFIDSLLCCYGFDVYCGIYHKQFYMRKSLVCDIIEPFRVMIDKAVRKGLNLKEIQEKDFDKIKG